MDRLDRTLIGGFMVCVLGMWMVIAYRFDKLNYKLEQQAVLISEIQQELDTRESR